MLPYYLECGRKGQLDESAANLPNRNPLDQLPPLWHVETAEGAFWTMVERKLGKAGAWLIKLPMLVILRGIAFTALIDSISWSKTTYLPCCFILSQSKMAGIYTRRCSAVSKVYDRNSIMPIGNS
ncbi:hypothetical protein CGZ75_09980 [Paenibacillus herberti]|uniref:Uncharacterized protein n=1 Tax=Paenibacillus herberti TaxID=1619309 RepID=A0A229P4E0_9BACL|nr:hypothetical protein CGZ75_09980 [Paenibacillus herberti]